MRPKSSEKIKLVWLPRSPHIRHIRLAWASSKYLCCLQVVACWPQLLKDLIEKLGCRWIANVPNVLGPSGLCFVSQWAIWMGIEIHVNEKGHLMYLHQGTLRITTSKSQPATRRPTMLTCQAWPSFSNFLHRWEGFPPGSNRLSHEWLSAILFLVVPCPGLSFQIRCSCCQKAERDWQRRTLSNWMVAQCSHSWLFDWNLSA